MSPAELSCALSTPTSETPPVRPAPASGKASPDVACLRRELAAVLVAANASPAVVTAAARRFAAWYGSLGRLAQKLADAGKLPPDPPSCEDAALAIVAGCLAAERAGTLERPLPEPPGWRPV